MQRAQGFAMQGDRVVFTNGSASTTLVQESAPFAGITAYLTGTTTLATLYSDNQIPPTPMANPFTANADGYWFFYAIDGRYDVLIESPDWSWTIGDVLLQDGGRWTADQNANGHRLNDLGGISFVNGQCRDSIALDANCNLLVTGTGGNTLLSLSPAGDLTIPGRLQASSIELNNGVCSTAIQFDANCNVVVYGSLATTGNLKVGGGFELDGPWLSDQNANGHVLTGLSAIQMSNGTCSTQIAFDANCFLVVYGSLGVTQNLDVNGLTNLAGKLKVDGGFELDGPWLTDQNANGHELIGLNILGVSTIHLASGSCAAEIGFDANCNVVLYGNLKVNGSLDASGGITIGGQPLDVGVASLNGLKGDISLVAGPGVTISPSGQSITISALAVSSQDVLVEAGTGTARVWQAVYQNPWPYPIFVTVSINLGPHDGAMAWCASNNPPSTEVAVIQSQSEDFTQLHALSFWVLPGYYYMLDRQTMSSNPDWPALINTWVEWH